MSREDQTFRDDRLFVIATEDTYAPKQYFRLLPNPRIHVEVRETEGGLSAPEHVLARLDAYVQEYQLDEHDERWLMLDTDHWLQSGHVKNFIRVCSEAVKKGYQLAHSNPCFEIWLLLHHTELDATHQFKRCGEVKAALGQYNGGGIDPAHFTMDAVRVAVGRAEKLDDSSIDRWPQKTGSHVYKLVKRLLPPTSR